MREMIRRLKDCTSDATFRPLQEQLVRLGWTSRIVDRDT